MRCWDGVFPWQAWVSARNYSQLMHTNSSPVLAHVPLSECGWDLFEAASVRSILVWDICWSKKPSFYKYCWSYDRVSLALVLLVGLVGSPSLEPGRDPAGIAS